MPKYVLKTDPPVDIVKIEKPTDHPSIIVDPEGFRKPYVNLDLDNGASCDATVEKGMILMLRDDKPVGLMPAAQFYMRYAPIEEDDGDPTPVTDVIVSTLVKQFRASGEDVTITLDVGVREQFLAENAGVPPASRPGVGVVCAGSRDESEDDGAKGDPAPPRLTDRFISSTVAGLRAGHDEIVTHFDAVSRARFLIENADVPTFPDTVEYPEGPSMLEAGPEEVAEPEDAPEEYPSVYEARADHFERTFNYFKRHAGCTKVSHFFLAALCWCDKNQVDFWKAAGSVVTTLHDYKTRAASSPGTSNNFRWRP